jgi:hypothetical protein
MATTQLFAELLIIGIGVAVWLALLVGSVLGYRVEAGLSEIGTPALVALGGVAYVLGIVVDRLARNAFDGLELRLCKSILGTGDLPEPGVLEREILEASAILGSQIQYNRSRFRICRAWVFNSACITLAFLAWNLRVRAVGFWESGALVVIGAFLCVTAAWATRTLARDHYVNLRDSYSFLKTRQPAGR